MPIMVTLDFRKIEPWTTRMWLKNVRHCY